MNFNSMSRIVLAFVLSLSLITTGCSAQWISVALRKEEWRKSVR